MTSIMGVLKVAVHQQNRRHHSRRTLKTREPLHHRRGKKSSRFALFGITLGAMVGAAYNYVTWSVQKAGYLQHKRTISSRTQGNPAILGIHGPIGTDSATGSYRALEIRTLSAERESERHYRSETREVKRKSAGREYAAGHALPMKDKELNTELIYSRASADGELDRVGKGSSRLRLVTRRGVPESSGASSATNTNSFVNCGGDDNKGSKKQGENAGTHTSGYSHDGVRLHETKRKSEGGVGPYVKPVGHLREGSQWGETHDGDRGGRGVGGDTGGKRSSEATFTPAWARPSTEELDRVIEAQFGQWRALDDAVSHPATQALHEHDDKVIDRTDKKGRHEDRNKQAQSYCKSMQQGDGLYPARDIERCYDQLRGRYQFGPPLKQVGVVSMGTSKIIKETPRGIALFMSTSSPDDIRHLVMALKHLTGSFLRRNRYAVAIIHQDFTREKMERLSALVPVPVHFLQVKFDLPDWMEPLSWIYPLAAKRFTGHPESSPLVGYHSEMRGLLPYGHQHDFGYLHKRRFFAGAGFMLSFFHDFDFYLRLDSDSVCRNPLPDYFQELEDAGADYAFDSTFLDYGESAQVLWNFAERYASSTNLAPFMWNSPHGTPLAAKQLREVDAKTAGQKWAEALLPSLVSLTALDDARERTPHPNCDSQPRNERLVSNFHGAEVHSVPCKERHFQAVPAFDTQFEVVRIQMIRSAWYQDWFNAVDKTGSLFFNRWSDAPIRFLGLSMHLRAKKMLQVNGCMRT